MRRRWRHDQALQDRFEGTQGLLQQEQIKGKCSCFKCGKSDHFIAQCPDNENDEDQDKKEKEKFYRNKKGKTHIGKEWDSDCSSSDSDDEGLAAYAFNKSSLFPNEHPTCLMAKEKKVHSHDTPSTLPLMMMIQMMT
jgi:hypothetical protein